MGGGDVSQRGFYEFRDGFDHIAIEVPAIYGVCKRLEAENVAIPRPPGPMMKHGGPVIAFIQDPDGYKIELIERS